MSHRAGGMSEIYLGFDRRVRRRVAVKVLYGSDEAFVRRFEHEAVAIGTLSHDHILPLYDFGVQRPWYYLVMPFVEGGTLRDYLLKCERFTLEEAGSFSTRSPQPYNMHTIMALSTVMSNHPTFCCASMVMPTLSILA